MRLVLVDGRINNTLNIILINFIKYAVLPARLKLLLFYYASLVAVIVVPINFC